MTVPQMNSSIKLYIQIKMSLTTTEIHLNFEKIKSGHKTNVNRSQKQHVNIYQLY